MKLLNVAVITFLTIASLCSCSQSNKYSNSAHGQLKNEQARVMAEHKDITKSLKDIKGDTENLIEDYRAIATSDSRPLSKLIDDKSLIIKMEGTLEGHEATFEQNEVLFDKHEDSPLSPQEIEAQHNSVANNLRNIKGDLITIKAKSQLINNRHVAIVNETKTDGK